MKKIFKLASFVGAVFLFQFYLTPVSAQQQEEIPHYTVILNQVRGTECCDVGSVDFLQAQLEKLNQHHLVAGFSIRFDALQEPMMVELLKKSGQDIGALLEVTPSLAARAGVEYKGDADSWFEAHHVFLIGYSDEERKKLIDAYMAEFLEIFGVYPKFSTAWMIDPYSLGYIKEKYGVVVHQITREQYGTDSYTLYGGPAHYPYWPSKNWALIPVKSTTSMPLIIRQTITDPVFNYGDQTSGYTSQPNDYFIRGATTEYFHHVFLQAHDQDSRNGYTFALIGLENSLPENIQQEYSTQIDFVAEWVQKSSNNYVVSPLKFETALKNLSPQAKSAEKMYHGSHSDKAEQAWWFTSDQYRVRVRLSDGKIFLSDLRVYDPDFKDPYLTQKAGSFGWWIVPFFLDSSRDSNQQTDGFEKAARNDQVKDRPSSYPPLSPVVLAQDVDPATVQYDSATKTIMAGQQKVLTFKDSSLQVYNSPELPSIFPSSQTAWKTELKDSEITFMYDEKNLENLRSQYANLLFPELTLDTIDQTKSSLVLSNQFAVAARNPVRLIFYPVNASGKPVFLSKSIEVTVSDPSVSIKTERPHGSNGMIFIDATSESASTAVVTVKTDGFEQSQSIYFAPNCKNSFWECLLSPRKLWWYLRSWWGDYQRAQEQKQNAADLDLLQ